MAAGSGSPRPGEVERVHACLALVSCCHIVCSHSLVDRFAFLAASLTSAFCPWVIRAT